MKRISTTTRVTPYVNRFCWLVARGSSGVDDAYNELMSTDFIKAGVPDPTVPLTPSAFNALITKRNQHASQKKRYMSHFSWFTKEMFDGNVTMELLQLFKDNLQNFSKFISDNSEVPVARLSFMTFLYQLLKIYPDPSILSQTRASVIETIQTLMEEEYENPYMMYVCCKLFHTYCPEGMGMIKRSEYRNLYNEFKKSATDKEKLIKVVKDIEKKYWDYFAVEFDIEVFDSMAERQKSEVLPDSVLDSTRQDILSWNDYVSTINGTSIVPTIAALVQHSFETLDLPLLQLMDDLIREINGESNARKNQKVGSALWDLVLDKVIKFCDLHYKTKGWQLSCTSIIQSLFWSCTERIDDIQESFQPYFQRWIEFAGTDNELLPHLNCIMFLKLSRNSQRFSNESSLDLGEPWDFDDLSPSDLENL